MSGVTLITGGGGYLGFRTARRLLDTTQEDLLLWTHHSTAFTKWFQDQPRIRLFGGELTLAEPFAGIDPRTVRRIVHSAAVTRFNVDPETATAVNVEGTRKLLRFAASCPSLQSVDLLSTIYVAGLREGVIDEEPSCDPTGFANEYERSKWYAERLLIEHFSDLPWRIVRIATVIAHDSAGQVVQQNAVHNTLKLLYYGLLSLVPGKPEVPLYFVSGDFASAAIVAVMQNGPLHNVFHVCHTREESLTLREFIDTIFEAFETDPKFRARRALKPLYTDAESFEMLMRQVSNFSAGILGQAAGSVAPFARQLFSTKEFRNQRVRALLPAQPPDPKQLVWKVCQNLIDSRFGIPT